MKKVIVILGFLSGLFFVELAHAHLGGHGELDGAKVIGLAQTSAKMLTFKAGSMSVGKLEPSWNDVTRTRFNIVEETKETFIISALNPKNEQRLYFIVSKNGMVEDVQDAKQFNKVHGHY